MLAAWSFDARCPMPARRALFGWVVAAPLVVGICSLVAGCGWQPLYADPQTGPADAELRAIHVVPIAERVGQKLEIALRDSLNPHGEPTPQRYSLQITLQFYQLNLGINTQGLGTRGRTDVYATFYLHEFKTGGIPLAGTVHANDSFDLVANGYANIVGMNDSETRVVEELRRDLLDRLTIFMQRRIAGPAKT
jgi:LPS-assembly lipoprotein